MKKTANPICKSCGDGITRDEGIMTTLAGAYHKDNPDCNLVGTHNAPAPKTLAGVL